MKRLYRQRLRIFIRQVCGVGAWVFAIVVAFGPACLGCSYPPVITIAQ